MARYWINGGVNNNWGSASNWSASSGGTGGSPVPTSSDDVNFDDSGNVHCNVATSARSCRMLTITLGYTSKNLRLNEMLISSI